MYLFTLIALPAFCLGTYFMHSKSTRKAYLPPVLIGFISASIYCFIEAFFILTDHIMTENAVSAFFYIFFTQTLIPSAVITALFFLFSKDTVEYKIDSLLPLLTSFNAVYIPYKILTSRSRTAFFPLFEKIILYISLFIFVCTFVKKAYKGIKGKKILPAAVFILFAVIACAVPAIQETLWYYKAYPALRLIVSAAYLVLSIIVFLKLTVIEFKE